MYRSTPLPVSCLATEKSEGGHANTRIQRNDASDRLPGPSSESERRNSLFFIQMQIGNPENEGEQAESWGRYPTRGADDRLAPRVPSFSQRFVSLEDSRGFSWCVALWIYVHVS